MPCNKNEPTNTCMWLYLVTLGALYYGEEKKHCLQGRGLGNVFCMLMLASNTMYDDVFSVGTDGRHHPYTSCNSGC